MLELLDHGETVYRFLYVQVLLSLNKHSVVEKTLLEQLPMLAGVRDMTDHSDRSNAYY